MREHCRWERREHTGFVRKPQRERRCPSTARDSFVIGQSTVGYQDDTFVVVEPVMGYRTIHMNKLERYRAPFGDAAIVFSRERRRARR